MKKTITRIAFIILAIALNSCVLTEGSMFEKAKKLMESKVTAGELIDNTITNGDATSYYVSSKYNIANEVIIVFVHGSPGGWYDFGEVLLSNELQNKAHLVSIDRPGWGNSLRRKSLQIVDGNLIKSADIINKTVATINTKQLPIIFVGHSYGVPIALQAAVTNTNVVGLLLLSGDIDPKLSAHRFYNVLAKYWPVRSLLAKDLLDSNVEMLSKQQQIYRLSKSYHLLATTEITVVQGAKDWLVKPKNLEYAKTVFKKGKFIHLPKQGHLTHYLERKLIIAELLDLINRI